MCISKKTKVKNVREEERERGQNSSITIYIVERFFTRRTSCLSTLGSQARMVLFLRTSMGRLWVQSHIGKRSAPLMLVPSAYKA